MKRLLLSLVLCSVLVTSLPILAAPSAPPTRAQNAVPPSHPTQIGIELDWWMMETLIAFIREKIEQATGGE